MMLGVVCAVYLAVSVSVSSAVRLDKSLLYGHNQNYFTDNDANNHYATCMVRTQGFDLIKNLTLLPTDVLANYICNTVQRPTLTEAERNTRIRKRETDRLVELKSRFGSEEVDKLQLTLRNFFDEDLEQYYDTLISYTSRFYYAELRVMKDALKTVGVTQPNDVIDAIKNIRNLKSMFSRLVGFAHSDNIGITEEGRQLLCELVDKLPRSGDKALCSYWTLVHLLGEPCGPVDPWQYKE